MAKYHIRTIKEKKAMIEYSKNHSKKDTCRKFKVSYISLLRWIKSPKRGGAPIEELLARKPKRHTVKEEAIVLVKKLHAQDPSLRLVDLKEKVKHIQDISMTTIWHAITGR